MRIQFISYLFGLGFFCFSVFAQENPVNSPANAVKFSSSLPVAVTKDNPVLSPAIGNSASEEGKKGWPDNPPAQAVSAIPQVLTPPDVLQMRVPGELNFRETDMRTVLTMIAEQSGVVIDFPFKSEGAVTLALKDIPLGDLLLIVLDPHGMGFVSEGGRVRVLPPADNAAGKNNRRPVHVRAVPLSFRDPHRAAKDLAGKMSGAGRIWIDEKDAVLYLLDTPEYLKAADDFLRKNDLPPLKTEIFSLSYMEASRMFDQVKAMLTMELGTIKIDAPANTLVVTDTAEKVSQVAELLKRIDQRQDVLLNIAVYKIQLNEEHQDGIDWEAIVSQFQRFDIWGQKDGSPSEKNRLSLGTLTGEDYEILIEALETVGTVTRLREEQVVAVMNQETAIRLDGSLKGGDINKKGQGHLTASKPVNPSGFSLSLKVKPFLNDKNTLALDIFPKLLWRVEGPARITSADFNNFNPQDHMAVNMGDNDVFVMGSLLREKEVKQISKFPLLGDLPLFGFVFRHQNRLIERTEYAIFIVPQVSLDKNFSDRK